MYIIHIYIYSLYILSVNLSVMHSWSIDGWFKTEPKSSGISVSTSWDMGIMGPQKRYGLKSIHL